MTSDEEFRELSREAGELSEAVEKLNEEMSSQVLELAKVVKRDRGVVRWLVVSVITDVILSFALGIVAVQASQVSRQAGEATSEATQNRINARVTCEAANVSRAAQIQLWTYVLSISPPKTPEEVERQSLFKTYVGQVFAARNCEDPTDLPTTPIPPPTLPTR